MLCPSEEELTVRARAQLEVTALYISSWQVSLIPVSRNIQPFSSSSLSLPPLYLCLSIILSSRSFPPSLPPADNESRPGCRLAQLSLVCKHRAWSQVRPPPLPPTYATKTSDGCNTNHDLCTWLSHTWGSLSRHTSPALCRGRGASTLTHGCDIKSFQRPDQSHPHPQDHQPPIVPESNSTEMSTLQFLWNHSMCSHQTRHWLILRLDHSFSCSSPLMFLSWRAQEWKHLLIFSWGDKLKLHGCTRKLKQLMHVWKRGGASGLLFRRWITSTLSIWMNRE